MRTILHVQYILFMHSSTILPFRHNVWSGLMTSRCEEKLVRLLKVHWGCMQLLICCGQGLRSLMRTTVCNQHTYSSIITLTDFNHRARKHIPSFFHHTPVSEPHYLVQDGQHLIQQVSRKNQNKNVSIKTSPSLKFMSRLVFPHTFVLMDSFWLEK
jgi:hypothetical protein